VNFVFSKVIEGMKNANFLQAINFNGITYCIN